MTADLTAIPTRCLPQRNAKNPARPAATKNGFGQDLQDLQDNARSNLGGGIWVVTWWAEHLANQVHIIAVERLQ
jgi:hypothetical protein